jgi:hypothetical protein
MNLSFCTVCCLVRDGRQCHLPSMLIANPTTSKVQLFCHPLLLRFSLDEFPTSVLVLLRKYDAVEVVWNTCRVSLTLDERSIGKHAVSMIARDDIDQCSSVGRKRRVDGMLDSQDDLESDKLAIDNLVILMNLCPVQHITKHGNDHKLTIST